MTIYVNRTGSVSSDLSALTKVKRVHVYRNGNWHEVTEVWHNASGSPSSSVADMERVHRTIIVDINTNQENYTLFSAAGSPSGPVTVIVNIASGVTIGATATTSAAFDTGTGWHAGARIEVINNGTIVGKGGSGGDGGDIVACADAGTDGAGSNGGDAINLQCDINLTNNGIIGGGGGGGAGGFPNPPFGVGTNSQAGGGGGGGAGYSAAPGGAAGLAAGCAGTNTSGTAGQSGAITTGGAGGTAYYGSAGYWIGPASGGAAGADGASYQSNAFSPNPGGGGGGLGGNGGSAVNVLGAIYKAGGAPGKAIEYNGNTVTLTNNGSVYGATS